MGYNRHHQIIVLGFQQGAVLAARAEAGKLFNGVAPVSEILSAEINDWFTFMVGLDGSKEGWADSDRGDLARAAFIDWLRGCYARDEYLTWVEIALPEDGPPEVEANSYAGREAAIEAGLL